MWPTFRCWVNLAEAAVAFFVVGPLIVCCSAVVILVEASGVEDYYPPLPFTDLKLEESAKYAPTSFWLHFQLFLSLSAYAERVS